MERLDLVNGLAPLAPELSCKEGLHSMERANRAKQAGGKLEEDVVHNVLKREMLLYRQAQAAVLKGLPRLQSLRVKTKRPDDYFAKMAKSDQHMDKIRAKLLSKGAGEGREDQKASGAEKIRKEGAGGSSAEEAEGEEGNAGRDEEDEEGAGGQHGQHLGEKRDSKGKVGGGRKEQKVWVPWKEERCEEE